MDWERIENRIIDTELGRFYTAKTDTTARRYLMALLKLVMNASDTSDILSQFCSQMKCSASEGQQYIDLFEALFPLKITS